MPPIPKKILSRKDEITADFMILVDRHFEELLQDKVAHFYHTRQFADQLFIHPRHLTNTIKATTGKSPCEILEERLLKEVQIMLRETDLPIAEIGYRFRYSEATNFVKFYKSMTGTTPLQYRKELKAVLV